LEVRRRALSDFFVVSSTFREILTALMVVMATMAACLGGAADPRSRSAGERVPGLQRGDDGPEVFGVLLLFGQDLLEEPARRRIVAVEVADDRRVGLDRDALRDEVLLDHLDQRPAFGVLGRAP